MGVQLVINKAKKIAHRAPSRGRVGQSDTDLTLYSLLFKPINSVSNWYSIVHTHHCLIWEDYRDTEHSMGVPEYTVIYFRKKSGRAWSDLEMSIPLDRGLFWSIVVTLNQLIDDKPLTETHKCAVVAIYNVWLKSSQTWIQHT